MRRRQQKVASEDAFSEFLAEQPGIWPERPDAPEASDSLSEFETEGGPDQWLIAARGKPPAPIVHHTPHLLVVAAVFLSLLTPAGLISTVIVGRHLNVSPMQLVDGGLPPLPPSLLDASAVQPIRLAASHLLLSLPAPSVDAEAAPPLRSAPALASSKRSIERTPSLPVATPAPTTLLPLTTALITPSRPAEDKPASPAPAAAPAPPAAPAPRPVTAPEPPTAAHVDNGPSTPDEAAETTAVRAALNRYRNAFSNLDASGAKAVFPDVDEKMLTRAFSQLEQQSIVFDACNIDVAAARATASCNGRLQFVPKVGSRTPRFESRQWTFTLNRGERDWWIQSVSLR